MELILSELTKEYRGIPAVDHVNLTMQNGVYALLGVNGAGKTTLMRMLCTLMRPTSGSIFCNGQDIFAMDGTYRALLGYLPQEFGFYPDFTVEDYLRYIASIKGIRLAVAKKRMESLLHQVGMTQHRRQKMKKLSGGMKRRVGIAQAMLNDPQILILDEPTAGLDPGERIRFRNLISAMSQDRLVLLSTHIVSDITSIADEILLMKGGSILHAGTEEALLAATPVRAWRVVLAMQEADRVQKTVLISNRRSVPGGVELRIVSENCPRPGAVEDALTLEDLFLYLFGERTEERTDEV